MQVSRSSWSEGYSLLTNNRKGSYLLGQCLSRWLSPIPTKQGKASPQTTE